MNPGRAEILSLLRLLALKSYDEITDIDIQSILKYNEPFELTDDLQIPYIGKVRSLITDGLDVNYLPLTGGTLTGPLTMANGENIYFKASEDSPNDQGEFRFLNFDDSESAAFYKFQFSNRFIIRYGGTGSPLFGVVVDSYNMREFLQTVLPVTSNLVTINWQSDLVPHPVDEILTRTYAQKHGNFISSINGYYDDGGVTRQYTPNYSYTKNSDGSINTLTITDIFAGNLIII